MEIILLAFIAMLSYALHDCTKQRNIYYSNYRNCLLALKEHDPKLSAYMEEREKNEKSKENV